METLTKGIIGLPTRHSILLAGFPKSGKSSIALSFPKPINILHTDQNQEPAYSMFQAGENITINYPDPDPNKGWQDIHKWWLEATHRKLDAQTIVIDTYSTAHMGYLVQRLVEDPNQPKTEGAVFSAWREVYNKNLAFISGLTGTRKYIPGKPSYNVIFVVHLAEGKNSEGEVTSEYPDIQGKSVNNFAGNFSTVLYCRKSVKVESSGNPPVTTQKEVILACSVPPSAKVKVQCGDSFGGVHGRKRLPPVLESPNYKRLCEAWGIQPDPDLPSVFNTTNTVNNK